MTVSCEVCDDEFELEPDMPPMCRDCLNMVTSAAKKREESRGSGGIAGMGGKVSALTDRKYGHEFFAGGWVQYDKQDQMRLLAEWSSPEYEYHLEDERRFNDIDLMMLSYWRLRKALDKRGFTDVDTEDVEDYAQDVAADMLQALAANKDIKSIHGYHWGLVNARMKKLMTEHVERRLATIPEDIIDYAEAHEIPDPYNYGTWDSLERRRTTEPLWTRLSMEDIDVQFGGAGINLTNREVTCLRNALVGENRGFHGNANTKKLLNNVARKVQASPNGEQAWTSIKEMIDG